MDNILNLAKTIAQSIFGVKQSHAQDLINPYVSSTNVTTPKTSALTDTQVKQGFLKYDASAPLATQSGIISQALSSLSPNIDPKLVLGLALKESSGGKTNTGENNAWNVKPNGHLVNYPDLKTALLGGDNPLEGAQSKGLINMLNTSPAYEKYRQSGDLTDFFSSYSPPGIGNPDMNTQLQTIRTLMKYWQ